MFRFVWKTCTLVAVAGVFASCGGGGGSTQEASSSGSNSVPVLTGNWDFTISSAVLAGTVEAGGGLTSNGNKVMGVLHVIGSQCFTQDQDVPISGTLSASNQLSATTAAVNGQVITVSALVSADGKSMSAGTYSISGGCGNTDHGSVSGTLIPSFSGTYSGTYQDGFDGAVQISFPLTESSSATPNGLFTATTAKATLTNAVHCFAQINSTATLTASAIAGRAVDLLFTADQMSLTTFGFEGTLSADAKTIAGKYSIATTVGNGCNGETGSLSLSR